MRRRPGGGAQRCTVEHRAGVNTAYGAFTPSATLGKATRYLLEQGRLALYTKSDLAHCRSHLTTCKNIDNSGGKSQKHENSHWWVVGKHASPCGVVPNRASSCGQMALGPICWWRKATFRRAWCKILLRSNHDSVSGAFKSYFCIAQNVIVFQAYLYASVVLELLTRGSV